MDDEKSVDGLLLIARWPSGSAAPEPPPASWWRLYSPLSGDGESAMLAVPSRLPCEVPCVSMVQASLYRLLVGRRPGVDYLDGNGPISIFGVDVEPDAEEGWNEWYNRRHFPEVVSQPDVVAGSRLRLEERICEGLGRDPRYVVVYEMVGEEAARRASDPRLITVAQRRTFDDWVEHGRPPTSNPLARKFRPAAVQRRNA